MRDHKAYLRSKERASAREADELDARDIRCPECGHKILVAYGDAAGHVSVYCIKCHEVKKIDFKRFRTGKKA